MNPTPLLLAKATLLMLAALALCRLWRRRDWPGQRRLLEAALCLLAALPLTPWLGVRWELWQADPDPEPIHASTREDAFDSAPPPEARPASPGGAAGVDLLGWLRTRPPAAARGDSPPWPRRLAWLYAGVLALLLARLAVGQWRLRLLARSLAPCDDAALLERVREFARELGVDRRIDVCVCREPNLTATLGLRRPVIVLPPEWRRWSAAERDAALAHELAHVRRRDPLTRLLAELLRAAYWFHPLAHLLVREYALRQELDADAAAARLVGGVRPYRRSLALLVLRLPTDGTPPAVAPMPTLLGDCLRRRLEMLTRPTPAPAPRRALLLLPALALLGLLALLQPGSAEPRTNPPTAKPRELPEFESAYRFADSPGLLALRPVELLTQPGMEGFRDKLQRFAARELKGFIPEGFRFEQIEQVVTDFDLMGEGTGKPGSRFFAMGMGGLTVRMVEKFDWPALVQKVPTKVRQVEGESVHVLAIENAFGPGVSGAVLLPDERTAVFFTFLNEEDLKGKLRQLAGRRKARAPQFLRESRGAALVVHLNNQNHRLDQTIEKNIPLQPEVHAFLARVAQATLRVELGDDRPVGLVVRTHEQVDTRQFARQFGGFVSLFRGLIQSGLEPAEGFGPKSLVELLLELTDTLKADIQPGEVRYEAFSKKRIKDFPDLVPGFLNEDGK